MHPQSGTHVIYSTRYRSYRIVNYDTLVSTDGLEDFEQVEECYKEGDLKRFDTREELITLLKKLRYDVYKFPYVTEASVNYSVVELVDKLKRDLAQLGYTEISVKITVSKTEEYS